MKLAKEIAEGLTRIDEAEYGRQQTVSECEGCGKPLGPFDAGYSVCMDCTRARHRAVLNHGKCTCGNKKNPGPVAHMASRSWIPCKRCLGSIKQLS